VVGIYCVEKCVIVGNNNTIWLRMWMVGKKGIMWCCSGIQTRVLVGSQAVSEPILRHIIPYF